MKALSNSVTKDSSSIVEKNRDKKVNSYYLYEHQIKALDELSGGHPSRLLRSILENLLGGCHE